MVKTRILFFLFGICLTTSAFTQKNISIGINESLGKRRFLSKVFVVKEYYENGNLRVKGQYLKCTTRNTKLNADVYESRKVGRWEYYHVNGNVERVENYNQGKNCSQGNFKFGKWKYWNEDGELYFEEEYAHDTLVSRVVEIYNKKVLRQKIITKLDNTDTIQVVDEFVSKNLIRNSGFENYNHKPVTIVNSGQNSIEDLIPDWSSPDHKSPDYYNFNRKVRGIFNITSSSTIVSNGFVGLVLYHEESNNYLEYLQTKLIQKLELGKMYCYKLDIQLSQNAGYSIDRFGARFFNRNNSFLKLFSEPDNQDSVMKIDFKKPMNTTHEWVSFCDSFIAKGDEEFLAIGRFAALSEVHAEKNIPRYINKLDVNKSAYYLIDNIEVFQISSLSECNCDQSNLPFNKIDEDDGLVLTDFKALKKGDNIILKNIHFDNNSAKILPSSFPELQRLRDILLSDLMTRIKIVGHTDNTGEFEYNVNLSKLRSKAVRDWLVMNGIDENRLQFDGYGFNDPLANNSLDEGRKLNRRVEIIILDK